ncbi:hypothetical protein AYX15_04865 [Cryptococcus neoformans]|nr:hypothetical protein AYX15_04865 [Cryptococcus neoformans var. grubii]
MEGRYNPFEDPDTIPVYQIFLLFITFVGPPTFLFVLFAKRTATRPYLHHTATILVLGDIGRSPRMMYHSESLARHNWRTFVVGYAETPPTSALLEHPMVHLLGLKEPPKIVGRLPWVLRAPVRIIYQIFSIIHTCIWRIPCNTEILLVQNPPSIPTLAVAQFICLATKTKLIIDWHNTGYSILGLRVGESSRLVRIAKWFESTFGQTAYAHLFVTKALQEFLVREWDLKGRTSVLHDRPPTHFHRTVPMIQHELFSRFLPELKPSIPPPHLDTNDATHTAFTEISSDGLTVLKHDRPALIISSTSWTADEDFSLLITALDMYQSAMDSGSPLPKLVILITGKGILRAPFENIVKSKETSKWRDITVRCVFVPTQEYPPLLGCADLGVSLHTSSSGKDLPMKVVDMFGCGVPVLAKDFQCIDELVKDGENGKVFGTGEELGEQMIDILSSFPSSEKLDNLKAYFDRMHTPRRKATLSAADVGEDEWSNWDDNWDNVVYNGILNKIRR